MDDVLEGNDDFVRKGVGREPNQLGYAKPTLLIELSKLRALPLGFSEEHLLTKHPFSSVR